MTLKKKPLPIDPDTDDLPGIIKEAMRAWGSGTMTPSQQKDVLRWIIGDLTQCLAIDPLGLDDNSYAFARGQRRVGIVIAKLTGAKWIVPAERDQ